MTTYSWPTTPTTPATLTSPVPYHPEPQTFIAGPRAKVKAYWWKGRNLPPNWGDWLTPLLLSRFAHVEAEWVERGSAQVVAVGSILGNIMGPWYTGTSLHGPISWPYGAL